MAELNELFLYHDKGKRNEVKDSVIEFEPVITGEISKKDIFLFNAIRFAMKVTLELTGKDIKIVQEVKELKPKETKKVVFELTPALNAMDPIRANLRIKIFYIVTK